MTVLASVAQVAKLLGCSERRVRTLLSQGRIIGFKQLQGWRIPWPPHVRPGTRGPDLRHYPARKLDRLLRGSKG